VKKLLSALVVAGFLFSLGCGGDTGGTKKDTAKPGGTTGGAGGAGAPAKDKDKKDKGD
jgi:hypothetical protein